MCVCKHIYLILKIYTLVRLVRHITFFLFPQNYKECFHQYSYNFYLFFYHLFSENSLTVKINK